MKDVVSIIVGVACSGVKVPVMSILVPSLSTVHGNASGGLDAVVAVWLYLFVRDRRLPICEYIHHSSPFDSYMESW